MKLTKKQIWQIVGVCALIVIMMVCASLGVMFSAGLIQMPTDNSYSDINGDSDDEQVYSPLVIEDKCENGIALTSSEATVASDGSTYQIVKAQALDASGNEVKSAFNWSVKWCDENSSWASGKNIDSYIYLSVSEDTKQCSVSCLKGFSEQISLEVSSKGNPSARATVLVDYVKRITSITSALTLNGVKYTDETPKLKILPAEFDDADNKEYWNTIKVNVNYSSVGTVSGKFVLRGFEFCGYTDKEEGNKLFAENKPAGFVTFSETDIANTYEFPLQFGEFFQNTSFDKFQSLYDIFLNNPGLTMNFGLYVDLYYNGSVVQTFVSHKESTTSGNVLGEVAFGFNTDYLSYNVSQIKTNYSTITF